MNPCIPLQKCLASLLIVTAMAANLHSAEPLVASTFLGDVGKDGSCETPIAVDAQGNVFIAGRTRSADFPVVEGCYDADGHNGGIDDIFVSKFSPDLTTLLASTYLGGSGNEGTWPGVALAIDADDNIYVAGRTFSADFPHDYGSMNGTSDAFLVKFGNNLETMLAGRLLGGSASEYFLQLGVGTDGSVYVSGTTGSSDFVTTAGAFETTFQGAGGGPYPGDLFVSRYSSDLSTLIASTYVGGNSVEYCEELLVGASGDVYLAGWVASDDFPTSETAYDRIHGGGIYDAFVTIISSDLTSLVASTYVGGGGWDFAYGMTLDASGNVYITGHTQSNPYPTTTGAWDRSYGGGDDAIISLLDPTLENMLASTYLGGSSWDFGTNLTMTPSGDLLLLGTTSSSNFPVVGGAYDPSFNGSRDLVLALFTSDLTWRKTATFFGGNSRETPTGLEILTNGDICIGSATISSTYPMVATSYDPSYNGTLGVWDDNDNWGGDVTLTIMAGADFSSEDTDEDGVPTYLDNCREAYNPTQSDDDYDLIGDACDPCTDTDFDGFGEPGYPANTCEIDNCPGLPNADQGDLDSDGVGNECDNCVLTHNPDQIDLDENNIGDACEGCCISRVGNANGLGGDEPTIGDVSVMIDAKFITGSCDGILECLTEADINRSGGISPICDDITISDVSILIDYLFITGPALGLPDCL